MGFWSGIKHALNSTLGKPYFRSLDDIILGTKTLFASTERYYPLNPLISSQITVEDNEVTVNKFTMYLSGNIRLLLTGEWLLNNSGLGSLKGYVYAKIFKNGTQIEKVLLSSKTAGSGMSITTFAVPTEISVDIGDVIEVKYYATQFTNVESFYLMVGDNAIGAVIGEAIFKNER